MATLIKLTKTDGTTKGGYHWDVGTTHSLPAKDNPQLCPARHCTAGTGRIGRSLQINCTLL